MPSLFTNENKTRHKVSPTALVGVRSDANAIMYCKVILSQAMQTQSDRAADPLDQPGFSPG